jgi:hypothetical protein
MLRVTNGDIRRKNPTFAKSAKMGHPRQEPNRLNLLLLLITDRWPSFCGTKEDGVPQIWRRSTAAYCAKALPRGFSAG